MIELLTVIAIVGILAAIAFPRYTAYKTRAYDTDSKANLDNLFKACTAYWVNNSFKDTCTTTIAQQASYGFNQSPDVTITVSGSAEAPFTATASHSISSNTFTISSSGDISSGSESKSSPVIFSTPSVS